MPDFGHLVLLQILETNTSMSHQEQMQFPELSQNSRWPDREETVLKVVHCSLM